MSGENDMSNSIPRAQKTHMSIKVDFKSHTLFGTHRKRICQVKLPQVSYSIRHAQKVYMLSKIDLKSRTLLGTHSTRTLFGKHKKHMSSEIYYKSRALFGTHYHCCVITVVIKTKTPENEDPKTKTLS